MILEHFAIATRSNKCFHLRLWSAKDHLMEFIKHYENDAFTSLHYSMREVFISLTGVYIKKTDRWRSSLEKVRMIEKKMTALIKSYARHDFFFIVPHRSTRCKLFIDSVANKIDWTHSTRSIRLQVSVITWCDWVRWMGMMRHHSQLSYKVMTLAQINLVRRDNYFYEEDYKKVEGKVCDELMIKSPSSMRSQRHALAF